MNRDEHMRELIERSSLGTPEAKALRASVPDGLVAKVMRRLKESENAPLLTEAAGPCRCRDCPTWIDRGDPCVDMRDGTGDVLCAACGDEIGVI